MAASHKRDYYEVLIVTRTATAEEIKSAYRKAALKWHPDRHATGKKEAEAHFREATEAYTVLSDGNKRAAYDRYGHAGLASGGFEGGVNSSIFEEFQDIFGDFFGFEDIFSGRGGRRARGRAQRGADLRYDMQLSFEEAAAALTTKVRVPRQSAPASSAAGAGSCITSRDFSRFRGRARDARAPGRWCAKDALSAAARGAWRKFA